MLVLELTKGVDELLAVLPFVGALTGVIGGVFEVRAPKLLLEPATADVEAIEVGAMEPTTSFTGGTTELLPSILFELLFITETLSERLALLLLMLLLMLLLLLLTVLVAIAVGWRLIGSSELAIVLVLLDMLELIKGVDETVLDPEEA